MLGISEPDGPEAVGRVPIHPGKELVELLNLGESLGVRWESVTAVGAPQEQNHDRGKRVLSAGRIVIRDTTSLLHSERVAVDDGSERYLDTHHGCALSQPSHVRQRHQRQPRIKLLHHPRHPTSDPAPSRTCDPAQAPLLMPQNAAHLPSPPPLAHPTRTPFFYRAPAGAPRAAGARGGVRRAPAEKTGRAGALLGSRYSWPAGARLSERGGRRDTTPHLLFVCRVFTLNTRGRHCSLTWRRPRTGPAGPPVRREHRHEGATQQLTAVPPLRP